MNLHRTKLKGLFVLETINFKDNRGQFQKLFNFDEFEQLGLNADFREFYYSVSHEGVLRGMHFQLPPHDHEKLVYVSKGKILDVVLDLRKKESTFGAFESFLLDDYSAQYLYIPKGCAHGFLSLEDGSIVNYAQTSCYNKNADSGVLFNSFGMNWGIKDPIISNRDKEFVQFDDFKSPFL